MDRQRSRRLLLSGLLGLSLTACSTAEPPKPEVRTRVVTETVEVTPQACLDAVSDARLLLVSIGDSTSLVMQAIVAGSNQDVNGAKVVVGQAEAIERDISNSPFSLNADACELSGP